ncbi:RluA family pseudouridine synthase, partial [Microbacterium natoriense]|uniref:RluA family pseudouridine synthase n=1 Tax=Microbacterium natoriense TaxID=284570 RepID=UPI0031CDCB47
YRDPPPEKDIPFEIVLLHQDRDLVVVDKPTGVAAHPSLGWEGPTVVGALAAAGFRVATTGAPERQGVVHRLDVGTSGLMVVAKTESAYTALKRAFKERTVEKIYHAVVQGHPDPLVGTIDAPIGRHPNHSWKFAVTPDGKSSVTHYETLEAFPGASLLEIHLETGRTHQIRVHMAALRHPCVGDPLYGADPTLSARLGLTRQWLHAHQLGFTHPATGEWVQFESPYPADFRHALAVLRGEAGA